MHPTDEELLNRLLESEWRDDLFDDLGDRSDLSARLFDVAMKSLKRTNETASRMVKESASFRRDFDAWLATHAKTQRETRAMIEDLVNAE